jgi:hypothetical protein
MLTQARPAGTLNKHVLSKIVEIKTTQFSIHHSIAPELIIKQSKFQFITAEFQRSAHLLVDNKTTQISIHHRQAPEERPFVR